MKKRKLINYVFLIGPILILIIISLLCMRIAGTKLVMYDNYFFKQAIWFSLGILALGIIVFIKPKFMFKYSKYLYFGNVVLLILVLFFGKTVNGARAWFDFGFFSFQPSELMKFSLALYLSECMSTISKGSFRQELRFILKVMFLTLIPSLFVFLEPDTGAIIIYLLIMFGVILVYKINIRWYFILGGLVALFLGSFFYLYFFNEDILINIIGTSFYYRVERLITFVNNSSFQLDRALIAIGSSNFIGNNYVYIPEAPTDFIIALMISNLGIFSFVIVLGAFLVLDVYFLVKLFKSKNIKNKMFIASFLMMFIFAQIENIGMNLGIFPIIGLPLPFVSYGGTNIIVYFMFLGVLVKLKD